MNPEILDILINPDVKGLKVYLSRRKVCLRPRQSRLVARSCKRPYETMTITKTQAAMTKTQATMTKTQATTKTMTKAKSIGCAQLQEELA